MKTFRDNFLKKFFYKDSLHLENNYSHSPKSNKHREDKVILVTGCNSGIGRAIADYLYENTEYRVVATCRKHAVEKMKKEFPENHRFLVRELDVTDERNRENLVDEIYTKWKSIDVLINNAGLAYRSVIEHMDDESEMLQLSTNYLGPMALVRLVFPTMREQGFGRIINISSVSGIMAMPTMASYSASKHALEGASESLWYEAKPFGISVSVVQLGFVKSKSFERVYFSKKADISQSLDGPFSDYYENMGPFIEKFMNTSWSTPEKIARKIIRLIEKSSPPLWVSATPDAFLFYWLRKCLPRRIFHGIMFAFLPGSHRLGKKFYMRPKTLSQRNTQDPSKI